LFRIQRQTEADAFALPGRSSGVTSYQHPRQQKHLPPLPPLPLRYTTVLCFVASVHLAKQTSDRLIASAERQVTIIPLTTSPTVGRSLVLILRSRELPFSGSRKKIDTRDSRALLPSKFQDRTHFPGLFRSWKFCKHNSQTSQEAWEP